LRIERGPGPAAQESPPRQPANSLLRAPAVLAGLAGFLFTVGLALSYHVPCGSEYYSGSLCYQPRYKNWAPQDLSSEPVSASLALTQEIVPACNGMTELGVWVNSNGADPAATTTLTLRSITQEQDLVQQTFRNSSIGEGAWLMLSFPPQWSSLGDLYLLKLTGSATDGIRLGYSAKADYLEGKLLENDSAQAEDLLFQYGCIAGLQRLAGIGR
jgi:hypothetical protein